MIRMKTAVITSEWLALLRKKEKYRVLDKVRKYIRIASVRLLSMISMSFENRFVMRPNGVVSKNDIGARRVRLTARLSITLLAVVPAIVSVMEYKNWSSA
jgi:hypothetical protein